ncbi:MAG: peptide deformylase [Proteobacteria bacterium]|nr:peptide deformylase [Pseudomonadota bacterium]MBU1584027.1 peptide deformylase [Pseudomonadota bacterium]MBU2455064.1 peptide deformylase [Pseudomonadota bacterium]MBU2630889.1 peptide deformylase [Pseudomonadota bacterium]
MAILKILTYPEKSLLQPSVKVDGITDEIKKLVEDMGETMFEAPGVGLAAPQVGVNKRIIVYDSNAANPEDDGSSKDFTALINPEIIHSSGSIVSDQEACLSVVDYSADVNRYETVVVKALDIGGKALEFEAHGILAVIMQHEIDHLDGILFIDRISLLKRSIYKKKVAKLMKAQ